ncbi:MAG: ABC transporter permease [Acidimicrobiia bacterium]|nr:ABC transporter permease [Acidimicrobiia bacterium]
MAPTDDPQVSAVEELTEPTGDAAAMAVAPELMAQTLGEYVRAWVAKVRGGDAGALPVIAGLIIISVLFQSLNSKFLTAGNLVNLLIQSAVYMLLAMSEVYVLLLGEIDLSSGFVAGLGGVVMAELMKQGTDWPWWLAVVAGLLVTAAIGALHGTLITRIGLPSFVVTLAGLLGWQGVMLLVLGQGGVVPIGDKVINNITSGQLSVTASWIVMLAIVAVYCARAWLRDSRRRGSGLVAPPVSLTVLRMVGALVAGVVVVLICNTDRGINTPIKGLPWVVLLVLAVLAAWTFLLGRTTFGRYVYAIGGNPEAARRAGVSLPRIRTLCFALASFTAGIAGIVYASRLRSVSTSIDGGTLVLYAVAAAVIGGTSLFGGRGKAANAVLGGLVIGAIDNGMGLQGYSAYVRFIVTALVLLAAVTIDALTRRGRTAR